MGFENVCRRLLEYGVLAPSIYNSQPWKFSIDADKGFIRVEPDPTRIRPLGLDPGQRDLYLAIGACVENMILAAPALGYEVEADFFPPKGPTALLRLKPMAEAMPESLFPSLLIRQTHAGKYKEKSVQELHLERLRNVASFSEKEKMYFVTEAEQRDQLISLLHDASHEGAGSQALIEEVAQWIRPSSGAHEGLPMGHLGLPISVRTRFMVLRYFSLAKEIKEVARQTLLRQGHLIEAPAFLLLTTGSPNSKSYFNAGRWHTRLTLTLSEIELGAQTLHLPVVLKTVHPKLLEIFKTPQGEEPVMLIRFGQPEKKAWPRTFRRPLSESLIS